MIERVYCRRARIPVLMARTNGWFWCSCCGKRLWRIGTE